MKCISVVTAALACVSTVSAVVERAPTCHSDNWLVAALAKYPPAQEYCAKAFPPSTITVTRRQKRSIVTTSATPTTTKVVTTTPAAPTTTQVVTTASAAPTTTKAISTTPATTRAITTTLRYQYGQQAPWWVSMIGQYNYVLSEFCSCIQKHPVVTIGPSTTAKSTTSTTPSTTLSTTRSTTRSTTTASTTPSTTTSTTTWTTSSTTSSTTPSTTISTTTSLTTTSTTTSTTTASTTSSTTTSSTTTSSTTTSSTTTSSTTTSSTTTSSTTTSSTTTSSTTTSSTTTSSTTTSSTTTSSTTTSESTTTTTTTISESTTTSASTTTSSSTTSSRQPACPTGSSGIECVGGNALKYGYVCGAKITSGDVLQQDSTSDFHGCLQNCANYPLKPVSGGYQIQCSSFSFTEATDDPSNPGTCTLYQYNPSGTADDPFSTRGYYLCQGSNGQYATCNANCPGKNYRRRWEPRSAEVANVTLAMPGTFGHSLL